MPVTSRRTAELGTENAFVVLAEVNDARPPGQGHHLVLHRPARFPDPGERAGSGDPGDPRGQARLHAVGRDRRAARSGRATTWARMRGLDIRPEHVVVGAGAKPFIAYAILATTDYGVGDEVIYPNPGFPIYESQIKAHGAVPVPLHLREARNFAFDPAELEAKITPRTKLLILNSPHNPTGGILARARPGGDRRDPRAGIPTSGSTPTRSTRACATRASSPRSPRFPGCTSARSSPTARPRPGR